MFYSREFKVLRKWKWYLALWTVGPYDPWPWSYVRLFKLLKVATSFHTTKQIWYEVRSNSRYIARWTLMPREILFYCFAHHFVNFTLILIFVLHMWHWLLPYIRPKHMKAIHQVYLEITMLGCWPLSMKMRNESVNILDHLIITRQQHLLFSNIL